MTPEAAHREPDWRDATSVLLDGILDIAASLPKTAAQQRQLTELRAEVRDYLAAQPAPVVTPDREAQVAAIAAALDEAGIVLWKTGTGFMNDSTEGAETLINAGLSAAPSAPSSGDSLDVAWREAEAALPEGQEDLYLERHMNGYFASLDEHDGPIGEGETSAAALHALAERLRAEPAGATPESEG